MKSVPSEVSRELPGSRQLSCCYSRMDLTKDYYFQVQLNIFPNACVNISLNVYHLSESASEYF